MTGIENSPPPNVPGRLVVQTTRLCVLNLPLGTDWWALKEFAREKGAPPAYIWITESKIACWGIMQFEDVEAAQKARDILNALEFQGTSLYVRQDKDDDLLPAFCTKCNAERNPGIRGEWWGNEWFCWPCATYNPSDAEQPVFDTHCHIDEVVRSNMLTDSEVLCSLERLSKGPVTLITSCCDRDAIEETVRVVEIARRMKKTSQVNVYCCFGIHPKKADQWTVEYRDAVLRAFEKCGEQAVAWGECGLDFSLYPDHEIETYVDDIELQKQVLIENITIAAAKNLPLILHARDCEKDLIELLEAYLPPKMKAQLHCAILSSKAVNKLAVMFENLYFGLAGYLSLPDSNAWPVRRTLSDEEQIDLHKMTRSIPLCRIVLETDAPAFRVVSGGPCDVLQTALFVAQAHNKPYQDVLEQCMENARDLFGVL